MSDPARFVVFVCDGPTCGDQLDSPHLHRQLAEVVRAEGLDDRVSVDRQTCFGFCQRGPNLMFAPAIFAGRQAPLVGTADTSIHHGVTPDRATELLRRRLAGIPVVPVGASGPAGQKAPFG